jgi:hypothetical protein
MALPPAAVAARGRLSRELHRRSRHTGVVIGRHGDRLKVMVLTAADDAAAARSHARYLLTAALDALGLEHFAPHVEVMSVVGMPILPGGPRRVGAAPRLDYRAAAVSGDRVVRAASSGPMGEWFAFVDDEASRVIGGRILIDVLGELFELPWGKKGAWVHDAIAQLAGHPTSRGIRYPCPCCDLMTLEEAPAGTFAICAVCGWEDDGVQLRDPSYEGGANKTSLLQARASYRRGSTG